MPPPLPLHELDRLKALRKYEDAFSPTDPTYARITRQAARAFHVPMAFISLLDIDQQRVVASHGVRLPPIDRVLSFDAYAVLNDDLFVVEDTAQDVRFQTNPLVLGEPHVRFYAAAPLMMPTGTAVGMLSIADDQPRSLTVREASLLVNLADHLARYAVKRQSSPVAATVKRAASL